MALFGMIGSGSFSADERPENWRQKVLQLDPNNSAPLTSILSKMKSESTDDPAFHWFEKTMSAQAGNITEVYTNVGLTTAYVSGATVGSLLYVNMPLAFVQECPVGKVIALMDNIYPANSIAMRVQARTENGAASYLTCKVLQADPNGWAAAADIAVIAGSMHEEGAEIPRSVSYSPTPQVNYCQIHRTSLEMTRTAMKTALRTGDKYKDAKAECLKYHMVELERASFFGAKYQGTGTDGFPERGTGGIIEFARSGGGLIDDFRNTSLISATTGTTFASAGEDWLDEVMRRTFINGSRERVAFVGSKVIAAVNKLIKGKTNISYSMTSATRDYGINVTTLLGPFGKMEMINHPLFNKSDALMGLWVSLDPANLRWRYIDDTQFYKDGDQKSRSRYARRDRTDEEFLTEGGLEVHHASTIAILSGFGGTHL